MNCDYQDPFTQTAGSSVQTLNFLNDIFCFFLPQLIPYASYSHRQQCQFSHPFLLPTFNSQLLVSGNESSSGLSPYTGSFGFSTVSWLQNFVCLLLHRGPSIWLQLRNGTAVGICSISGPQRYSTCLLHKYMAYTHTNTHTTALFGKEECLKYKLKI